MIRKDPLLKRWAVFAVTFSPDKKYQSMITVLRILLFLFLLRVQAWPTSSKPKSPRFPIPQNPYQQDSNGLREDFNAYMTYSYVTNCKSIWTDQLYPQGNSFEKDFPTTLVRGFFDSKSTLTAFVVYNDYLKSIVISFRPSNTLTLWKYDFQLWKSKFSSKEFPNDRNLSSFEDLMVGPARGVNDEDRSSEPIFLKSSTQSPSSSDKSSREPIDIPSGLAVHHGFKILYLIFRNEILALTMELALKFSSYKVVYTGHSLGTNRLLA